MIAYFYDFLYLFILFYLLFIYPLIISIITITTTTFFFDRHLLLLPLINRLRNSIFSSPLSLSLQMAIMAPSLCNPF